MIITELIKLLKLTLHQEGDIKVVACEAHEYWGTLYNNVEDWNIKVGEAQPDGPKSGKTKKCLILNN